MFLGLTPRMFDPATVYAHDARPPLYLFKRETNLDFSHVYPATPCAAALCELTHEVPPCLPPPEGSGPCLCLVSDSTHHRPGERFLYNVLLLKENTVTSPGPELHTRLGAPGYGAILPHERGDCLSPEDQTTLLGCILENKAEHAALLAGVRVRWREHC